MMKRALHAAHQRESFACEPVNIAQKRQTLQVEQWYVDIEGTKKAATLKSQALEAVEITHTPVELTREALKQRQRVDADLRRILLVQSDHNSALAFLDHMDDVMTRKAKKKRLCHSLADPRDPSGPSNKRPRRSEESNVMPETRASGMRAVPEPSSHVRPDPTSSRPQEASRHSSQRGRPSKTDKPRDSQTDKPKDRGSRRSTSEGTTSNNHETGGKFEVKSKTKSAKRVHERPVIAPKEKSTVLDIG